MRWYDWLANHSERRTEGIDIMSQKHCQICGTHLPTPVTGSDYSTTPEGRIGFLGVCTKECLIALYLGRIADKLKG